MLHTCLSHRFPPYLLRCSQGTACWCVPCRCGNSREHRGVLSEKKKNKYKHVTNTSTFTLHTTSSVCMRSIGMQTAACHHAHKQINNTGNTSYPLAQCSPPFVFHSLPLLWCSHLSRPPAGTDFLSPTHAQFYRKPYAFLTEKQVKKPTAVSLGRPIKSMRSDCKTEAVKHSDPP